MSFDLNDKLYIFEVSLGYRAEGEERISMPFLVRADDPEEAEEIAAVECLGNLDLGRKFWVADISEPFPAKEYEKELESGEGENWRFLEELDEDDLMELLQENSF